MTDDTHRSGPRAREKSERWGLHHFWTTLRGQLVSSGIHFSVSGNMYMFYSVDQKGGIIDCSQSIFLFVSFLPCPQFVWGLVVSPANSKRRIIRETAITERPEALNTHVKQPTKKLNIEKGGHWLMSLDVFKKRHTYRHAKNKPRSMDERRSHH
jgi:hypothetical protein